MANRVAFSAELLRAIRIRGLTLQEVAQKSGLSAATVGSAVAGKKVNMSTALRIGKAVHETKVIPELEQWLDVPPSLLVTGPNGTPA